MLAELGRDYEIVLGDSAAGIGPDVLELAGAADRVLVVTTPELPALTDAYGLFKALDQFGRRAGRDIPTPEIVVNMASGVEEGQTVARKLRAVCERFLARSPRQAGWVPRSGTRRSGAEGSGPSEGLERLCSRQMAVRLARLCAVPVSARA